MREHLEEYTKEQLLEQARSFELRKCSGLRKAALIERILECFCTEEMLRSRLACLTKEQMSLFRKACDAPCDISINELVDSMDKEFYIPSVQQIEEICRSGYEESSLAYKKLQAFFIKKLDFTYEQAVSWCLQVWANSYEGESPADMISKMTEADIMFKNEKQMNEFVGLLMDAHNNTRMKENRGHKPNELIRREFTGGMPTIVPGSSHAAAMLRDAAQQLKEMGIPIDLDGNADIIATSLYPNGLDGKAVSVEKKIYPNDPCPCGSGKKYKKCCGRR